MEKELVEYIVKSLVDERTQGRSTGGLLLPSAITSVGSIPFSESILHTLETASAMAFMDALRILILSNRP